LIFARDGDAVIVVGSNFGQDKHPAWSGNLLAQPQAVVTLDGKDIPVRSELLDGDAAQAAYQLMIAPNRTYANYRDRTDRTTRVFRLGGR
jgi:deazaflavin-dependent oxidoreductase (nitroreductase family)